MTTTITRTSPLVDSMISGDRAGIGGILANDVNGLCLIDKGNMMMMPTMTVGGTAPTASTSVCDNSGVYTTLSRLASTLTPCRTMKTSSVSSSSSPSASSSLSSSPLITIEMEGPTSILIKEYDGHTVAMRVPNVFKSTNNNGD
jgi:hypothetical protein